MTETAPASPATDSILDSIKKPLGLDANYDVFDQDVIMHINTVFTTLNDIGIGPAEGFMIEDANATWDHFLPSGDPRYSSVRTYIYLKVRLVFDPPATSFVIASIEKQIAELEWRLKMKREEELWDLKQAVQSVLSTDD